MCKRGQSAGSGRSETCLVMCRGLEAPVDVDDDWKAENVCYLHGSSWGADGEEAGVKGTHGWGVSRVERVGRHLDPGSSNDSQSARRGRSRSGQLGLLPPHTHDWTSL